MPGARPVDQGITSEDKSEPAEPEPVIETSAIPQEESRPNAASTRQQTPQGATRVEQSGDPEQNVGNASLRLAYLSEVQKTLERSTVNPDAQLSGTVLIDLTIASSGQVLTREVEKSSGSKVLDDAAITALDRAAPFPPMPRGVAKGPLKLQVPVEFVTR
jgi:protein TonB